MLKKNWLLLFSILFSCGKESFVPNAGYDYYPLSESTYRIYDVSETTYVSKIETVEIYQIRESFAFNEEDNTGILTIERRPDDTENWQSIESVAVRKTAQILEYRANNHPLVKLSFPVNSGAEWDGNVLNNDDEFIYAYADVMNEHTFGSTEHIKVVIGDLPANIVERDERYEIYAQNVGLVERNFIQLQICQQECTGINEPEDGTILSQRLIELGEI